MTNLTDIQRLAWPSPETGRIAVEQELDAMLSNACRTLSTLINDHKDPTLQVYLAEQIATTLTALNAIKAAP